MGPRITFRTWTPPLLALIVIIIAGCMSLERMAPPAEGEVVAAGQRFGFTQETLQRGRHIYLNQCIQCHTVEPIDRYSLAEWHDILPEMNAESKLNATQAAELKAYIRAAHEAMTAAMRDGGEARPLNDGK